ncbi:MAG TPA: glycosyltransferase [Alphaproteobacteria bacterium]
MHVAFFGSSLLSAYWNGAATYYRGLLRALAACGHQITFYEPDAYDRQSHRDIAAPEWARVVVYDAAESAVDHVLDQARAADVLVKASGVGVFDDRLESGVLAARRPGAVAIFWDVDAPATLDRLHRAAHDPLRDLVPRYDMVLTYGGGEPVVAAYRALGARACIPIYNALDPSTHHPVAPDPDLVADLCFVGNRLPDREARVDEFFFFAAAALPARRFLLGGSGWADKPRPANVRYHGHVYTHQHNALNCSSMAVLNVNRASMASYGFSPPTRIFEAAGAGACLITDMWPGIEQFLEPGREILVARSGDEVASHLAALDPARARRIGAAARARVLAEHTYAHRARQLDAILRGRTVPHERMAV